MMLNYCRKSFNDVFTKNKSCLIVRHFYIKVLIMFLSFKLESIYEDLYSATYISLGDKILVPIKKYGKNIFAYFYSKFFDKQ